MTTTIQKWGNSQGVRIPKMLLDSVNWSENEQIVIIVDNGKLIIEKAKEHKRKNNKIINEEVKNIKTPDWFDKNITKGKISQEEENQLEELLKEYKS